MDPALHDIQDSLNQVRSMIHEASTNGGNNAKTDEILGILGYLAGTVEELLEMAKHHDRQIERTK